MVSLRSIITAYPPDKVNELIGDIKPEYVNVFVDYKNVANALWVPEIIQEIIENSTDDSVDSTIFQSMIYYASFWKSYTKRFNKESKVRIYFTSDVGKSCYHLSVDNQYKAKREIAMMNYPSCFRDIARIRANNSVLAESVLNKLPDIYFFHLRNLEADFLPYYLITRKLQNNNDPNHLNIICSADKDMYQVLSDNTYMIYRRRASQNDYREILSKDDFMIKYTKANEGAEKNIKRKLLMINDINPKWIVAMMSLVGDTIDDIPGVPKVGPVKAMELFSDNEIVEYLLGTPEELEFRINNNQGYFKAKDVDFDSKKYSNWKIVHDNVSTVENSFKLISYECLSSWLDKRDVISKIEYLKYIDNIFDKVGINQVPSARAFYEGVKNMNGFDLTPEEIINLYE